MPRNPVTGSLDINDTNVYTGYAECLVSDIESMKIEYDQDGGLIYGVAQKKDGTQFILEGHDYYFFDKEKIGFSNDIKECSGEIKQGVYVPDEEYRAKIISTRIK